MVETKKKTPPGKAIKSLQYDLFGQFVTNDKNEVSNTVEVWESIPKYFFTARQVKKLRTEKGHADPYQWEYIYDGQPCTVTVQPALIRQKDGSYKAFFPGATEELVEEALKKIFADQHYGLHNPNPKAPESWVRFSLRMIAGELKLRGRSRSLDEIKHAIKVMSACILTVSIEKKEVWQGAILQDLVTVGRAEYLADTTTHHVARLPLFISHSINSLEYRQFNYGRLMTCNEQLSRWLYKRLINRFRQANSLNDYHFMYSDLKHSGLLQQVTEEGNRRKVLSALKELIKKDVLLRYITDEHKTGRKITNIKYTVFPSPDFITEQKAANKRSRDHEQTSLNAGVRFLGN